MKEACSKVIIMAFSHLSSLVLDVRHSTTDVTIPVIILYLRRTLYLTLYTDRPEGYIDAVLLGLLLLVLRMHEGSVAHGLIIIKSLEWK